VQVRGVGEVTGEPVFGDTIGEPVFGVPVGLEEGKPVRFLVGAEEGYLVGVVVGGNGAVVGEEGGALHADGPPVTSSQAV